MYEPVAKDFITTNGRHILVYDYLDFPFTVMLASDIVVGIKPEEDDVSFLIPDKNGVYVDITHAYCLKPTAGTVDINLHIDNLMKYSFINKDSTVEKWLERKGEYHTLLTNFFKRD